MMMVVAYATSGYACDEAVCLTAIAMACAIKMRSQAARTPWRVITTLRRRMRGTVITLI